MSLSTSEARSRAISGEAMAPRVHRARPTTNWVLLFRSLGRKGRLKGSVGTDNDRIFCEDLVSVLIYRNFFSYLLASAYFRKLVNKQALLDSKPGQKKNGE